MCAWGSRGSREGLHQEEDWGGKEGQTWSGDLRSLPSLRCGRSPATKDTSRQTPALGTLTAPSHLGVTSSTFALAQPAASPPWVERGPAAQHAEGGVPGSRQAGPGWWDGGPRALAAAGSFRGILLHLWLGDAPVADLGAGVPWGARASLWIPNPWPSPGRKAGRREGCELPAGPGWLPGDLGHQRSGPTVCLSQARVPVGFF